MPTPAISKQQVLAVLTAATHTRHDQGREGLAGLSMDELATRAGISRATLYRLFGSQQNLLQELGLQPPPKVRGRILDTALELVGRHGLAGLSMDELAAQAGVSRATLYRLFPGKAALFAELVRSFSPFEPIAAVLETMGERPPAEVIPAIAQAMAAAMDGHIGLLLQLLFEVARHPDPDGGRGTSEDAVQGMRTLPLVAGYLDRQMAVGRLRRMDPDLAFQALAGPIVMHLLWRLPAASRVNRPPLGEAPLEEVVDELVQVWLRAMATDQPAAPQPAASTPPRPRSKRNDRPDPN
jgi:TetR/AcrR family transcriptional regulator, mexJK operon transcriptional repressor